MVEWFLVGDSFVQLQNILYLGIVAFLVWQVLPGCYERQGFKVLSFLTEQMYHMTFLHSLISEPLYSVKADQPGEVTFWHVWTGQSLDNVLRDILKLFLNPVPGRELRERKNMDSGGGIQGEGWTTPGAAL